MQVIATENKPIKMWLEDIEDGALDQAKNLANLPFLYKHVAIMPDCHQGYGMPIGGVIATEGVVIPNAVGVDIGCGMIAMRYSPEAIPTDTMKKVLGGIRKAIPVGFNHHKDPQDWSGFNESPNCPVVRMELPSAAKQIGTLGGGNHFIEIQRSKRGHTWVMIHSGSRNFGLKIAQHYHSKAKEKCSRYYSNIPTLDLAFLRLDSAVGTAYMKSMNYALRFAEASRAMMMDKVAGVIYDNTKHLCLDTPIDVHHNYARMENHFGKNVMVHRKGATSAKGGEIGIIPGSQGTASYIVRGKGCPNSFMSCSHGAGRKMGRKQAQRDLNFDEEIKSLDKQGILHSIRGTKDLDEAPGAYKDIQEVMENQKELVSIVEELKPLAVIKA